MRLRLNAVFFLPFVLLFAGYFVSMNGFIAAGCTLHIFTILSTILVVIAQLGTARKIAHLRLVK